MSTSRFNSKRFNAELEKINAGLKPCPFCNDGNACVEVSPTTDSNGDLAFNAKVECWQCEAHGPDVVLTDALESAVEAARQWNIRGGPL